MIIVLAVVGTSLAYLFMATNVFKNDKELFAEYMEQNKQYLNQLVDSNIYATHEGIKQRDVYESNTTISASYSEGGEISNPINELEVKLKSQKENDYRYQDAQILFEDERYLEIEGIREQDIYGIRFSNALREFLSIRNSQNLQEEANKVGVEEENLEKIITIINNEQSLLDEIITKEEIVNLIQKYMNIVVENFNNATFSSQKNAMITYNNNTIKTNAYVATLSSNQVQNMIIQLLNNIKEDQTILDLMNEEEQTEFVNKIDDKIENLGIDKEVPTIKITLNEQDKKVVRTTVEIGLEKIIIENLTENGQIKTKIQRSILNNTQQEEQNIEIIKNTTESQEEYKIIAEIIEGGSSYIIEFNVNMTTNNGLLTTNADMKYVQGIKEFGLQLENVINVEQIENKVIIDEKNNVVLSDLSDVDRNRILGIVKTGVPQILNAKKTELLEKTQIEEFLQMLMPGWLKEFLPEQEQEQPETPDVPGQNQEQPEEPQITPTEINKFNSKFEFYTGESVSAANVKILLDVVKVNLKSIEFIPIENNEEESTNQDEVKETIKLNIEKDKENVELANQVLTKIDDREKYKVSITYKDSNGMIDYITITEIQ